MMDITLFEQELNSIHYNGMLERQSSNTVTEMAESVEKELTLYENFIPNFFYENGNEQSIRNMYRTLRDGEFTESTVDMVDLYESKRIYTEYHDGMSKFVREIISLKNDITQESADDTYRENLNKAKNADDGFVHQLFGGEYNKKTSAVMTEAVKNIEFLIDFIPEIDSLKKESVDIAGSSSSKDELVSESVGLLYDSICNYCFGSIKTTMETYKSIHDILDGNVKKEVVTEKKFKIW